MAVTTRATGGTAPAASLWPFYERKEVVKTFIMVTDEEENQQSHGFRWVAPVVCGRWAFFVWLFVAGVVLP